MSKFACNFDAIEIEAHNIIQEDNGQVIYEPWSFEEGGATPHVWSVFGHLTAQEGTPESRSMEGHGAGRELIADCETPEGAEFIAGLVREHLMRAGGPFVANVEIYWYTDRPGAVK